jgi:hypothetical protein
MEGWAPQRWFPGRPITLQSAPASDIASTKWHYSTVLTYSWQPVWHVLDMALHLPHHVFLVRQTVGGRPACQFSLEVLGARGWHQTTAALRAPRQRRVLIPVRTRASRLAPSANKKVSKPLLRTADWQTQPSSQQHSPLTIGSAMTWIYFACSFGGRPF